MDRFFLLTARTRGLPVWLRYGSVTILVGACLGLRIWLFGPGPAVPFLLFFPAVIISGMIFDRGTSIYATLLSALLALWYFVGPNRTNPVAVVINPSLALLVYIVIGLLTGFLLEAWHITMRRMADGEARLAAANARLSTMADERTMLLSEAVHRARNDLQRLSSMLQMQAINATEPAARQALEVATGRVSALARINARLDRYRDDGRLEVDSSGFLNGLVDDLRDGAVGLRPIALATAIETHALALERAVPIGLIVNELVGNALKYAFPNEREGRVDIAFRRDGDGFVLTVSDNGVGFDLSDAPKGGGLGTRLSRALAGQVGGGLTLKQLAETGEGSGVVWTVRFPVER